MINLIFELRAHSWNSVWMNEPQRNSNSWVKTRIMWMRRRRRRRNQQRIFLFASKCMSLIVYLNVHFLFLFLLNVIWFWWNVLLFAALAFKIFAPKLRWKLLLIFKMNFSLSHSLTLPSQTSNVHTVCSLQHMIYASN